MKVGDMIKCGGEFAIVLDVTVSHIANSEQVFWLECLWSDGVTDGIESDHVEYHYESR